MFCFLNGIEDGGLVTLRTGHDLALGGLHGNCALAFAVHVQELAQIETRTLQDLDFVDEDVVEGIDGLAGLLDVLADRVGNQLVDGFLQVGRSHLLGDDVHHLAADVLDLLRLSIRGLLDLVLPFLGETDAEKAQRVGVAGFYVDAGFDHGLPLLDHGPLLVRGEVHAVEVGQAVAPLDILADEAKFAEGDFVVLKIGQRDLVDATLQTVGGDAGSRGLVDGRLADSPGVEHDGGPDVVPLLARERVDDLLLLTLLSSLGETLVLANCHFAIFFSENFNSKINFKQIETTQL